MEKIYKKLFSLNEKIKKENIKFEIYTCKGPFKEGIAYIQIKEEDFTSSIEDFIKIKIEEVGLKYVETLFLNELDLGSEKFQHIKNYKIGIGE